MTALERQMAADAVALSKEHADRADAAEARAEAAEARLAKVANLVNSRRPYTRADVLAITGGEEDSRG